MTLSEIPELTRKEAIWLACKEKTCCHSSAVIPTGRDVWRIARVLDVPPWSFLIYFETPVPARDAFALDHSGRRFRLALAKGVSRRAKAPPPCIFLLRSRQGHHRCALGDLRPQVCQAFPSEVVAGVVTVQPGVACTCRTWALADVDITQERAAVASRQRAAEEYCDIVSQWNAMVAAAPPDEQFHIAGYCAYLFERYDALAHAAADPADALADAPAIPSPRQQSSWVDASSQPAKERDAHERACP